MDGHIFQLSSSPGGVPKLALREATLTPTGLIGDKHNYPQYHGGPERALCLYALECILALQAEGHPIFPGSVGENVTIAGIDWASLKIGSRLALGDEVVIEISAYAVPCKTIAKSFSNGKSMRISEKKHPDEARLYARVLQTGTLRVGQKVRVLEPAEPSAQPDAER